jgi:hypothetical protein
LHEQERLRHSGGHLRLMDVQAAGMLVDSDVSTRTIVIRESQFSSKNAIDVKRTELGDFYTFSLQECRHCVVDRGYNLHCKIVLARITVQLVGAVRGATPI